MCPTTPLGGVRCLLVHTCPQLAWNKQGLAACVLITGFRDLFAFKFLSFAGGYPWDVGGYVNMLIHSAEKLAAGLCQGRRCPGSLWMEIRRGALPYDTQSQGLFSRQTINHCPHLVGRSAACLERCQTLNLGRESAFPSIVAAWDPLGKVA